MSKKEKKAEPSPDLSEPLEIPAETPVTAAEAVAQAPSVEEQLAASQAEARKNWDLFLRERADLENARKRTLREKEELAKFANEAILREILPVIDNLERALQHSTGNEESGAGLVQGVELTLGQFRKVLEKFGVTPVSAIGTPFDPSRHEAMGQIESADYPANSVVQELQKGYLLNERLLRPALVMISRLPAAPPAA